MLLNIIRYSLYGILILMMLQTFAPYTKVDPELEKYDKEFLATVNKYCTKSQYLQPWQKAEYFNDLGEGHIGYCSTNDITKLIIRINPKYWNGKSEDEKFSTFSHEATHCYLNTDHSPNPNHFMFAYENYLSKETVQAQLIEFLKKKCNK